MKENQKPKLFLVLKILGFTMIVIGLAVLIVGLNMKVPEDNFDMIFGNSVQNRMDAITKKNFTIFGGVACIMFSIPILSVGFSIEIKKMGIKTKKYVLEENREDLSNIADITADIAEESVKQTARAIKEGFSNEDAVYCKYCGQKIDADSIFCKSCGKRQ